MRIVIDPAPSDYDHPEHDPLYKIGDRVRLPDGEVCNIISIRDGYRDRADVWHQRNWYEVDTKKPGCPVCWFFGWQLQRIVSDG